MTPFLRRDSSFTFHLFPTNGAVNIGLRVNKAVIVYLNASSKGDLFEGGVSKLAKEENIGLTFVF